MYTRNDRELFSSAMLELLDEPSKIHLDTLAENMLADIRSPGGPEVLPGNLTLARALPQWRREALVNQIATTANPSPESITGTTWQRYQKMAIQEVVVAAQLEGHVE